MTNEANITVTGHVGSEPRYFEGEGNTPNYVSFRMASTRSYFNRAKNSWVESETTWFTVKAWRSLARNINESIAKGDAVIVSGLLATQKWNGQDGAIREALIIDATAVGPNLARGTAKFRPVRGTLAETQSQNAQAGRDKLGASARSMSEGALTDTDRLGEGLRVFTEHEPGSPEDLDAFVESLTETSAGVYENLNDESATNMHKNEPKVGATA